MKQQQEKEKKRQIVILVADERPEWREAVIYALERIAEKHGWELVCKREEVSSEDLKSL